jgi:hypothetical protein
LSFPTFDDGSETNPKIHLQQLDEYTRNSNVPKVFQLTVAYKSITSLAERQWIQIIVVRVKKKKASSSLLLAFASMVIFGVEPPMELGNGPPLR